MAKPTPSVESELGQTALKQRSNGLATRAAILDAAEKMMAEIGYSSTTLRKLAKETHTNIASISYHFGSKASLLRGIYERRMSAVNKKRRTALQAYLAEIGDGIPSIEKLLDCFLRPLIEAFGKGQGTRNFSRLYGRTAMDSTPDVRAVVREFYNETAGEFLFAFRRACPELSEAEFARRSIFLYGAMTYSLAETRHVNGVLQVATDNGGEDFIQSIVSFTAAGFRAK